jgi:hypothetical protein
MVTLCTEGPRFATEGDRVLNTGRIKIMNSLFECINKKETRKEQRNEGKE